MHFEFSVVKKSTFRSTLIYSLNYYALMNFGLFLMGLYHLIVWVHVNVSLRLFWFIVMAVTAKFSNTLELVKRWGHVRSLTIGVELSGGVEAVDGLVQSAAEPGGL